MTPTNTPAPRGGTKEGLDGTEGDVSIGTPAKASGERRDSITITVPIPPKQMHPNSRNHWRAKLGAKAEQRGTAKLSALEALNGKSPPRWERATIHATFYRSSPRAKQQDGLNLLAWLKATEDGIEDAQIVANDRGVTWLAPSQVLGKAAQGRNEVVIVITKIEPTAAAG
jgi:hypothetical protein